MELIQYFRLFKRWYWLIITTAFVAASIAFILHNQQSAQYVASTTLIIGNSFRNPDPNTSEIRVSQDLTETYARIVRTFDIRDSVVNELDLDMSPEGLDSLISTQIFPQTALLQLRITYSDPILAADIANELARQLILASPSNLTAEQQTQVDIATTQIDSLSRELDDLRGQLATANEILERAQSGNPDIALTEEELAALSIRRTTLIDQINGTTNNVAQFTNIITSLQQRTNSIEVVESARIPMVPTGPSAFNKVLLGAMVGAAVAFGGVLLLEYLNDAIQNPEQVARALQLPILGVVSKIGRKKDGYGGKLVTIEQPLSRVTEEYNTLRSNLSFALGDAGNKILIVTSSAPQEGKSITAANMAVSFASTGKRVWLIDADLRRPRIHEIFNLPNDRGLSVLLAGNPMDKETKVNPILEKYEGIESFLHKTDLPNLKVMTSGYTPQNPNQILGSTHLQRLTQAIQESKRVDIVIFDCPPCLSVSDAPILANNAKANVLLVVEAERTRLSSALRAKEAFRHMPDSIIGVILNNAPRSDEYYGYGYYGYYYENAPKMTEISNQMKPELREVDAGTE